MQLLEGKSVAEVIKSQVRARVETFLKKRGRRPQLTVLLIGDDPASQVYVKNKMKTCEALGMSSLVDVLPGNTPSDIVVQKILSLNSDQNVDGILIQLPLPKHLDSQVLLNLIDPAKDVDALTMVSGGKIFSDQAAVYPCTPWGIIRLLEYYKIPLEGRQAVVIGRSQIVGKPMAHLLLKKNMTVTLAHSKSQDLATITQRADLVVVAAGKPRFFGPEYFSPQAVVIDVGIHGSGKGTGICGDVDFERVSGHVAALTPVPGGVGPLTISCLMENTIQLAELRG